MTNSLHRQLLIGFGGLVAVFALTLLLLGVQVSRLSGSVQAMAGQSLPMVMAVDQLDLGRSEVQQFLTDVSATGDPAAFKEAEEAAKAFAQAADDVQALLTAQGSTAALAKLAEVRTRFDAFNALGIRMAHAYLRAGQAAGNQLMKGTEGQPGFDDASEKLETALKALRDEQITLAQGAAQSSAAMGQQTLLAMAVVGTIVTTIGITVAGLISRRVLAGIGGEPAVAVGLVQRMAAGDLSEPFPLKRGDSTSLLAHLQMMQTSLAELVGQVRSRAEAVAASSAELRQGSEDLSTRTSQQASALQQVSATMAGIKQAVHANVELTGQADAIAAQAREATRHSSSELVNLVATMGEIDQASSRIADITGMIDAIAFQTNLLALNAAVEAARAGDQGRGFAVVASEVRGLAARSAEATRSIKGLISGSADHVSAGNGQVQHTREAMEKASTDMVGLSDTIARVASAGREQSDGVDDIAQALTQLDDVTQQNAALAEQSAAAATQLSAQAAQLQSLASRFKTPATA